VLLTPREHQSHSSGFTCGGAWFGSRRQTGCPHWGCRGYPHSMCCLDEATRVSAQHVTPYSLATSCAHMSAAVALRTGSPYVYTAGEGMAPCILKLTTRRRSCQLGGWVVGWPADRGSHSSHSTTCIVLNSCFQSHAEARDKCPPLAQTATVSI
jgi:hypothetical protein